jgi:hypothetical protein
VTTLGVVVPGSQRVVQIVDREVRRVLEEQPACFFAGPIAADGAEKLDHLRDEVFAWSSRDDVELVKSC